MDHRGDERNWPKKRDEAKKPNGEREREREREREKCREWCAKKQKKKEHKKKVVPIVQVRISGRFVPKNEEATSTTPEPLDDTEDSSPD